MCTPDSFLSSDEFYLTILHVLTVIEVPLHLFGAYVILAKTPKRMCTVKTSMITLHGLGALCDVYLNCISSPVLIIPSIAGYPVGVSVWLGIPTSVQVYIGFCSAAVVCTSVLMFFEDRLFVLKNSPTERRSLKRVIYQIAMYLLAVTFISPVFFDTPSFEEAKLSVLEKNPCFPMDRFYRPGFFLLAKDNTLCVICMCTMILILLGQLFYFATCIVYKLSQINAKSKSVARAQKQFFISLVIQVSIPVVIFAVPVSILIYFVQIGYYNQGLTNMGMVVVSSHGIASTVTMLIVHIPYRDATLEIFKLRTKTPQLATQNSKMWTVAGNNQF